MGNDKHSAPTTDKYKPEKKAAFSSVEIDQIKHKLLASSYTSNGADISKLFGHLNRDDAGGVDAAEFCRGIRRGKVTAKMLTDNQLKVCAALTPTPQRPGPKPVSNPRGSLQRDRHGW